jgi:hypothetical protein
VLLEVSCAGGQEAAVELVEVRAVPLGEGDADGVHLILWGARVVQEIEDPVLCEVHVEHVDDCPEESPVLDECVHGAAGSVGGLVVPEVVREQGVALSLGRHRAVLLIGFLVGGLCACESGAVAGGESVVAPFLEGSPVVAALLPASTDGLDPAGESDHFERVGGTLRASPLVRDAVSGCGIAGGALTALTAPTSQSKTRFVNPQVRSS